MMRTEIITKNQEETQLETRIGTQSNVEVINPQWI
jgi:hypothetical protein